MTMRLFTLPRLVVRLVVSPRCQLGRAMGACALATLLTGQAQAQLLEGWEQPGSGSAVGTAAAGQAETTGGYPITADGTASVYVGPGGVVSPMGVPSVLGPAPNQPQYVNQPYATGPFLQNQPIYAEHGHVSIPCDVGCDIGHYASVEALYFRREHDERFTFSQGTSIEPFDYEWGGRVTIGHLWDCVNGYEFSYAGPFEWERQRTRSGAANLQSRLVPVGVPASSLTAFNNASVHSQFYRARLNTVEFNRRCWAWDIFSTFVGIRAVDYREDYLFTSNNVLVGDGIYDDSTENIMVGPQAGAEYMIPMGLRTLFGIKGKGAVLANFNRNEVFMSNAGVPVLNAVDSDLDGSGMIELGTYVKYSITPSIRVTAGYELWYIAEIATVSSQDLHLVTPDTGAKVFADDELLIHGASFGAQILF